MAAFVSKTYEGQRTNSTEATVEEKSGLTISSTGKSGLDVMDEEGELDMPPGRHLTDEQRAKIRKANKAERKRKRKLRAKRRKK